jgi:hypothetical protein
MKRFLKKIKQNCVLFFYNLFYGIKNTEDIVFHQSGITDESGTSVIKEIENKRVSKALLKGEVTQEVEELRYRTYKVDKESTNFKYYAPTLALKKDGQDNKFMKYDKSDGLDIITIQPNNVLVENVSETLEQVGGRGKREEYTIKIKRDFTPRYRVEEYLKRLDVKKLDDTHVILDMYVSKYMNSYDFKSKGFIKEIEKIRDQKVKSDILDYQEISFITHHAYKLDDMIKFKFRNIWFKEVKEFDGNFILKFKAEIMNEDLDLTKRYFSKTMDDKYKNKEKKDTVVNFSDYATSKVYVCEECGKKVVLDMEMIDKLNAYQGRDITNEKTQDETPQVLEFMDMQISEQTYGKRLCSDCLKKYLQNNNLI